MGLTMREKKAVTREAARRYQKASKHEKGLILNELIHPLQGIIGPMRAGF